MDYREIYCTIRDLLDGRTDEESQALYAALKPADANVATSTDPTLMEMFASLASGNQADVAGYNLATKFADSLVEKNIKGGKQLKTIIEELGESGFKDKAALRLIQGSYALIHWLMHQLARVNHPCHQLDNVTAKFTPMIEKDGKADPSPLFTAYTRLVYQKPDFANDGYTNVTTFLLQSGDETAQTILIRMGHCLWETLYPMFELYNPHLGGETADFQLDSDGEFDGADIAGFLPLMVFLGLRLDFTMERRALSCQFRFHPINPTFIEVSEGDQVILRLEYLDDMEDTQEVLGGHSLLEALLLSGHITVHRPL